MAAQRIVARAGAGTSDADPAIAAAMATDAEPWPAAVTVPTTGSPDEAVATALAAIDAAPFAPPAPFREPAPIRRRR